MASVDYSSVLKLVNGSNEDAYTSLMAKESTVLDAVNKIDRQYRDSNAKKKMFVSSSVQEITSKMLDTFTSLADELTTAPDSQAVVEALTKEDRLIYVGLALIFFSIAAFVATA